MKYYLIKYKYLAEKQYNLGDNIQSIAAMNMLLKAGVSKRDIDYINGDELDIPDNQRDRGILIVQGWFGSRPKIKQLPVYDEKVHPLFFGFFLNEGSWQFLAADEKFIQSMKKYEPVGCRDYGTRNFLRSIGVKAYFSGCLTLTFDERKTKPDDGKIFFIDALPAIHDYVPEEFKKKVEQLTQQGDFPSGKYPVCDDDVELINQMAHERLELLKSQAEMVVTRRIHIAMPCAAMGIPVVFSFNQPDNPRVSIIKDILPVYDIKHFKDINWKPALPVMQTIKNKTRLIFLFRLQEEEKKLGINSKRLSDQEYLLAGELLADACKNDEKLKGYGVHTYTRNDFINGLFDESQQKSLVNNKSLVLFGAGSAGRNLKSILNYCGIKPACFCDNSVLEGEKRICQGTPVINVNTLQKKFSDSIILITVTAWCNEIKLQLLKNGFTDEQIIIKPDIIMKYAHFVVPDDKPCGLHGISLR
jgi:hypothetical protein